MFKRQAFIFAVVATLLTACGRDCGQRTVEYPYFGYTNAHSDVTCVRLTDTATFVTLRAKYFPHNWILWAKSTTLVTGGKSYPIKGGIGMTPGEYIWMNDAGDSTFTMVFDPIPLNSKKIDLDEGIESRSFIINDIDITGSKRPKKVNPVFKDKAVSSGPVSFDESIATSTVNVHLINFREGMSSKVNLYFESVVGGQQGLESSLDGNGNGTFVFTQRGSGSFVVHYSSDIWCEGAIAPGETLDVYLDLALSGQVVMFQCRDGYKIDRSLYSRISGGKYSGLKFRTDLPYFGIFTPDIFPDCTIDADSYYDALMSEYRTFVSGLDSLGLDENSRKTAEMTARQALMTGMAGSAAVLQNNYMLQHPELNWKDPLPFTPAQTGKKHFDSLLKEVDYNDPDLLIYGTRLSDLINPTGQAVRNGWITEGRLYEIGKAQEYFMVAKNGGLTPGQIEELSEFEWAFLREALISIDTEAKEFLQNKHAEYNTVAEWPGAEKWMQDLVAPYRGKVVMIDLWDTWCGPCCAALSENEPYKKGELSSDDIVWIYIADESSSLTKYLDMIKDIRGIHYWLTKDQQKDLDDFFNVDGIPYYILVEKDGTFRGRPDIRDHELYVKELKKLL